MSLGKISTKLKSGAKDLGSTQGIKHLATNFGVGAALGSIVTLILSYIMYNIVYPATGLAAGQLHGFSIFPNITDAQGQPAMGYDHVILVVISVILLFTKRLWLAVGFFTGFYITVYMGVYDALKLPKPLTLPL